MTVLKTWVAYISQLLLRHGGIQWLALDRRSPSGTSPSAVQLLSRNALALWQGMWKCGQTASGTTTRDRLSNKLHRSSWVGVWWTSLSSHPGGQEADEALQSHYTKQVASQKHRGRWIACGLGIPCHFYPAGEPAKSGKVSCGKLSD